MMMTMLAQQEIFTPAPTRRLIVRPGRTAWWGVDSSTKRVAIGTISVEGERGGAVVSIPTLEGAPRLAAIFSSTVDLCRDLYNAHSQPGVVVVEQSAGFGKRPNPELGYALGAVLAGVGTALRGTDVQLVVASSWKRLVCGDGAIKKPKPASGETYAVLSWARSVGYIGTSWDEADSWAIADYARRTFALEER